MLAQSVVAVIVSVVQRVAVVPACPTLPMSKRAIAETWTGPSLEVHREEALTASREILNFLEAVLPAYFVEEASDRLRNAFEIGGNPRRTVDFNLEIIWLEGFLDRTRSSLEVHYEHIPFLILRIFDDLRSIVIKKLNDYNTAAFFLA